MPLPFDFDPDAFERLPPEERKRWAAKLADLRSQLATNPLWAYTPHDKQTVYHQIATRVGAFIGGNRSGKTFGGTADDLIQLCDRDSLPPWLQPFKRWEEFHCWIVVPALVPHAETVALPLLRKLVPRKQLWKGSWERAWDARLRQLRFENGNTLAVMSHEMDIDRFSGASLHRVRFDEEPPGNKGKAIFRECEMRVLDTEGELRFTMTPLLGLSWTYHELTNKGDPRWDEECRVVTVDMEDNPHLGRRAMQRALAGLSEAEREARKAGRFVHFSGLIYPEFSEEQVVPQRELPRNPDGSLAVSVYAGIDPGIDHPAAVVWLAIDVDDRMTIFDSFKLSNATVEDVCALIDQTNARHNMRVRRYVIDPVARNRQHATGRNLQDEYRMHGVWTIPGQNARLPGYNRIKERLTAGTLEITANNEALIDEFREYRWKAPKGTDDVGRQEPVKVNDDLLDALRYVVMNRPRKPGAYVDDSPPTDAREFAEYERERLFTEHLERLRSTDQRRYVERPIAA